MSTIPATSVFPLPVRVGRWWFRNRSLSPLPFFLLMLFLPPDYAPQGIVVVLLLAGVVLAEGLRIWGVGFAGSATRTRGDSVPQLVHAGPYRWIRNPLYVGNIALYTLVGLLFGFTYLSAALFVYSCLQYTFIVRYEEDTLLRTFGAPYDAYRHQVPRWFPSLHQRCERSDHQFDLVRALKSEKSTFISMTVMALLFVAKKYFTA